MTTPDFSQIKIKDYSPEIRTLSNGIVTYGFRSNQENVVYMRFFFDNAGTLSQEKFFTASLTKTQLDKDTKDHDYKTMAELTDYYGLLYTPVTSNERTSLLFGFLPRYQSEIFPLLQQMILYPRFNEQRLSNTIAGAKQIYRLKLQQTSFISQKNCMSLLFGKDNPYGVYAELEDYDKVKPEDLKRFWEKRYSYNQCHIVIAGNADEEFYKLLDKYFGSEKWNHESADLSTIEAAPNMTPHGERTRNIVENAVQTSISMGRLLPKTNHEDYIPLTVLNCILGGYFNSRLMSNIREEKGYTYGINSDISPFKYGNAMFIVSDVSSDKEEATLQEIFKEMRRLQQEPVAQEELSIVKNYMIGELLRSLGGIREIADNYEDILRYKLRQDYNSYLVETIRNTDEKDVIRVAKKYLDPDEFIISLAGNKS